MKHKFIVAIAAFTLNALMASASTPNAINNPGVMDNASLASGAKIHLNQQVNRSEAQPKQILSAPTTGANGEIREPSGQAYDYLYSYYMVDAWGDSYIAGKHVNIYYDQDDNSVYLGDFLDDYMGDCYYVGGSLIEGDLQNGVMEFEAYKAVYYSWGQWLMLIIATYDESTGTFYVNEDETSFKLNIENGVISNYTTYLALASITDETDVYWLQSQMCYDPIDMSSINIAEIPESAALSHYYMTANDADESIACIYRDGNDFYFNNIFGEGFTFKGILNNDKIEVVMPQIVKAGDEFVYINTYYEVDGGGYKPGDGETVYFNYDTETGDISYAGECAITLFSGNKFLYLSYTDPYQTLDFVKFTEDEEPIVVPASAIQSLYSMSTGYDEQGNHKAGLMTIAREGNNVYFMRVDNTNYDMVMRGELDPETNKVTVPLSQIIGIKGSTFMGLALAKQSIVVVEDYYDDDYKEIRYVEDTESPAYITIDYDPETGIYQCNDVLAVINAQRHSVSIALITPTYAPVNEVAEIPVDTEAEEYVFSKDGNVNSSTVVNIYRNGDDFYFVHPSPNLQVEEMVIHGVLNSDGKIEIAVPQLVARGTKDQGVFMRVGTWKRVYTPDESDVQMRSWGVFYDEDVDKISFDYDEGLNEFDFDGYFSFVQFSDNKEIIKATTPYYKTYLIGSYKPAAPTDLALIDKSEDYWGNGQRYRLDFVIPCQDIDGRYLPYDNMSFRIYFNDEVFTFTPEEYPQTFTEAVSEVPFNHPASSEIPHPIWDSNMRQVYLYSLPSERIGVQSCYTYDGESTYSDITYIDSTTSLISTFIEEPVNVEYYDVWGRRTNIDQPGMIIIKKTYPDGSISAEKRIN